MIRELDRVILAVAVRSWDEQEIPAGTSGTVVGAWENGTALLVEFDGATGLLADVRPDQIAAHEPLES